VRGDAFTLTVYVFPEGSSTYGNICEKEGVKIEADVVAKSALRITVVSHPVL
jgi:hypothetical protein